MVTDPMAVGDNLLSSSEWLFYSKYKSTYILAFEFLEQKSGKMWTFQFFYSYEIDNKLNQKSSIFPNITSVRKL